MKKISLIKLISVIAILAVAVVINIVPLAQAAGLSWTQSGNNIYYPKGGNVGIGTTKPSEMLDIGGSGKLTISGYTNALSDGINRGLIYSPSGKSLSIMLRDDQPTADRFSIIVDADGTGGPTTEAFMVRGDGNVGIGLTAPTEKLQVNGNIKLKGNILSDGDICIGKCN